LVQSGNDKTKYAFGIGAYTQDGMVLNSGFEKVSGRLNIDHKITKNISMGANLSFSRAWKQSTDGSFNSFVTMPPLAKVYEDDGVTLRKDVTLAGESHFNPLWNINNAESRSQTDRLLINLFADWKIAPGLSYRLNTSLSERNVDSGSYLGINHTTGATTQGKATLSQSDYFDYLVENILNRGCFVIGFSEQDYEDLFDLRKAYEIQAVKWAIERITDDEMDRLEETFEFMEFYTMRGDLDKMLVINAGFHQVIYEASHNRMLQKTLMSYQTFLKYQGLNSVYGPNYLTTVLEEHRAIFKAFMDRDAKAGAEAMERHINRAKERRCG
jgi:hypothetical protein